MGKNGMRTTCFLPLFLVMAVAIVARAQVADDFSDGDFTHNPAWQGDSLHFEVNPSKQLHLRWSGSDTSFLSTQGELFSGTEWNFWVKLSFNTSANNFMKVYLTADRMELNEQLNGSFLQIGGASDSIFVMKQTGTTAVALCQFPDVSTAHSTNALRIKITCDETGWWHAWADVSGGQNLMEEGSWYDPLADDHFWFGFWCKYTSSNATKFYMDEVYIGPVVRDTIPPNLVSLTVADSLHLSLRFSENLELTGAVNSENYTLLAEHYSPEKIEVVSTDPVELILGFGVPFHDQVTDTLKITNLFDLAGNRMSDTLVPFAWFEPGMFDILIHEILMDPEPVVGLPPVEYVELFNRSGFPVDLSGWSLDAGSTRKLFPSVTIPPGGFLLISKDSSLASFGSTIPLFTSASTLSNEGTTLVLRNSLLQVIHTVTYSPGWIEQPWKLEGGWSLEMIDPENPCGCGENWSASTDPKGGTPGAQNSVSRPNPDVTPPEILRSYIYVDSVWVICFSESVDTSTLGDPAMWRVESGDRHPHNLLPVSPDYCSLKLGFDEPFADGQLFTLTGSPPITDCAGNHLETPLMTQAAIPVTVERKDVIINEVLPHPYTGSSRFIELYNRSDKVLDIKDLALLVSDTGACSGPEGATPVTEESYLMFPFDFVALCKDQKEVKELYYTSRPKHFLEISSFPQMKNGSGAIRLIRSRDEELIDGMDYHTGMHYPLLSSEEGVSLERISPDGASYDPSNWHSAGENRGFATPAYENSQWLDPTASEEMVSLIPPLFSPDNDGHDDVVSLHLSLDEAGFQASVVVFDASGRIVKRLVSCMLLGMENDILWDGIRDDGLKASMGIYLVQIELTQPDGRVKRIRKPLVVGGHL